MVEAEIQLNHDWRSLAMRAMYLCLSQQSMEQEVSAMNEICRMKTEDHGGVISGQLVLYVSESMRSVHS